MIVRESMKLWFSSKENIIRTLNVNLRRSYLCLTLRPFRNLPLRISFVRPKPVGITVLVLIIDMGAVVVFLMFLVSLLRQSRDNM